MKLLKTILSMLVSIFAPIILVFLGSAAISLGVTYDYDFFVLTGLILIAVGVIWGIVLYLYYDASSWLG